MATRAENIQTALDNIAQQIAEISAEKRPDYNVGGRSVSWASYLAMLIDKQEALQKALLLAQSGGPTWQISSRGEV